MDSWGENQCCEGGEHLAGTVQIVSEGSRATACSDAVFSFGIFLAGGSLTYQKDKQAHIEGKGHDYSDFFYFGVKESEKLKFMSSLSVLPA